MLPARDIVLLLTHSGDHYTVDRVAQELSRRGAYPLRIDTDGFPEELELTTSVDPEKTEVTLRIAGHEIPGREVQSVWLRRLALSRLDENLEPSWREGCLRESRAALEGFLDGLQAAGCRFVNPPEAGQAAAGKLRQLRVARSLGLEVPRTLVTNDGARVRPFFEQLQGRMVA